ncbi:MAG: hypothetical protein U0790_26975 [Isosphaeraceae bacterium]
MTEAEWLTCEFSSPMLEHLREHHIGSWRKRLFLSLACCRRVAGMMSTDGLRAVEVAERFVEGNATEEERWEAFVSSGEAMDEANELHTQKAVYCAYRFIQLAAEQEFPLTWDDDIAAWIAFTAPEAFGWTGTQWDETVLNRHRRDIADWVRDIFGNPFRPVTFAPAWRTPGVMTLATEIDERQSFDRIPSLADALEQSGCRAAEVLSHCRISTGHVRGCWVIEAILGHH